MLDLLQHEIEAREIREKIKAVPPTETTLPRRQPDFSWKPRNVPPPPTTGNFLVDNQSPPFTPTCVYCSEKHFSASCDNVTEISARKSILARDKRCFKYLRKGHHQDQCDKTCKRCARGHHQSICPRNTYTNIHAYNTQNSTRPFNYDRPPQEGLRNQTSKENESTVHGTTTATTSTCKSANPNGKVLLQTAIALASNQDGTKTTKARILFDNGSHRSYVTHHLQSRLNLKSHKTETLHLNTFGEQKYRKERCEIVKIRISKPGCSDEVEISALSFPVICSAIPNKVDIDKFPHIQHLELADDIDNANDDSIDILIGSDYYWNIVQGETIRSESESGPIAVSSKLGWILSGPIGDSTESDITISNLAITGEFDHYYNETDQLENTLRKFWDTEAIGIKDEVKDSDVDATDEPFLRKLVYDGKQYEVGLPWKENVTEMSDHYNLCFNRLKSMQRKLRDKPELLTEYD